MRGKLPITEPARSPTLAAMDGSHLAPRTGWALVQRDEVQLIDLRGRDAIDLPRIPDSRVIPLEELPSELATLGRERPVVFVSGTGRKALEAVDVLRSAGRTAYALEGGMRAWLGAGLPTENRAGESSAPQ